MQEFDLVVIGSGPAGQRASIQAAKLGRRVALVESNPLVGGVSLHTGTIPSKTLREAVLYLTGWRQRGFYGRSYRVKQRIGIEDLMQRLEITIRHEVDVIQHQLSRNGVTVLDGTAAFVSPHVIEVRSADGEVEQVRGENFVIATGTRPAHPEGIAFDGRTILDSDDILRLERIPKSMAVVGAGVIGVEYATIFSTLDVEITLIDARPGMLDFLDRELVDDLIHNLRDRDMTLRLGESVAGIRRLDNGLMETRLASGKRVRSEVVLYAAGRYGCTGELRLDNAGLETDSRQRLKVDAQYRTAVRHIFAAGDVIGFPSLASTSMEQGRLAACHACGACPSQTPSPFPMGIYAVPEISAIGRTEQELTAEGVAYEVGVARFRETARGQILGLREGVLKLIFSLEDRTLLGVHIVGEGATELIHIGQAALILGGTLEYFVETVFNYPTLAEAYKVAALDAWNRMC